MKRIDLSWPLVFAPKFAVECRLIISGVISVRHVNDLPPLRRLNCFPYVNFFYKLLLLLEMSDYTGGKSLFCGIRSKRSHEKGDLTGKAAC